MPEQCRMCKLHWWLHVHLYRGIYWCCMRQGGMYLLRKSYILCLISVRWMLPNFVFAYLYWWDDCYSQPSLEYWDKRMHTEVYSASHMSGLLWLHKWPSKCFVYKKDHTSEDDVAIKTVKGNQDKDEDMDKDNNGGYGCLTNLTHFCENLYLYSFIILSLMHSDTDLRSWIYDFFDIPLKYLGVLWFKAQNVSHKTLRRTVVLYICYE